MSSLTGTDRTLVAVGTVRLASMLDTVRAGAPRSTVSCGSSVASPFAAGSGSLGTGDALAGLGAGAALVCGFGAGRSDALAAALAEVSWGPVSWGPVFWEPVFWGVGNDSSVLVAAPSAAFSGAFALFTCGGAPLPELPFEPPSWGCVLKKSHHALSTLFGSRWYCWYISSTSHSFAPNSASGSSADEVPFEDSATA